MTYGLRTKERPDATGIASGLSRYGNRSYRMGNLTRNGFRYRARIAGSLSDPTEHVFPKENPERFRTLLIGTHSRNGFQLECQDDCDEQISRRKTMTVTHIGRVRVGHPYCIPERPVRHSTTSHVASMVTQ